VFVALFEQAASRAAGTPINFGAVAHNAASTAASSHVTGGVNAATNQAISQFTGGLGPQVKFSPAEVKAMASAIRPDDMQMVRRHRTCTHQQHA
jgi:hypothetical protein